MDRTTDAITTYATTLRYEHLTPDAVRWVKRSFIDVLGCALGASSEEPPMIAKKLAGLVSSKLPSRILGMSQYSSPEMAAFANTLMVHYLNFDHGWRDLQQSGGYPGRTIPAILAIAEPLGAGGRAVITATAVAYDVCYRVAAKIDLHVGGWNQSFYTANASAAGLVNLMGLSPEQAANAVSLAAINSFRSRQTRSSGMSMWKAADCADANRAVITYALLAREGMTGPSEPFEGQWGAWRQPGVENPDDGIQPFAVGGPYKVVETCHKIFPCHHHGQAAILLASELRSKVRIEEIESINIETFHRGVYNVGGGPDKPQRLDPQTREDADHSIPWLVAVAFRDGTLTPRSFSSESLLDRGLRPLMRKVNVTENAEFTREYPKTYPISMVVTTRSGQRHVAMSREHKGLTTNPLTDKELEAKFIGLAEEVLGPARCREALDVLWRLEDLETMTPLFEALTPRSSASEARPRVGS
jgi:2-methylcitrate dehydratase